MRVHDSDGVTVIHGDARIELEGLVGGDVARTVIVTDPVWPTAPHGLFGVDDPEGLFATVAAMFPALARRVVVQLGRTCDPRFLVGVPASMPFVCVCWLRHACPNYLGTVLGSGDVAYVYGSHEPPSGGRKVIGGERTATEPGRNLEWHPTPRKLSHVRWLIDQLTQPGDTVLDPFAGSGTTLLAAREAGRRAVGVEVSADYCAGIVDRLTRQGRLFAVSSETCELE